MLYAPQTTVDVFPYQFKQLHRNLKKEWNSKRRKKRIAHQCGGKRFELFLNVFEKILGIFVFFFCFFEIFGLKLTYLTNFVRSFKFIYLLATKIIDKVYDK